MCGVQVNRWASRIPTNMAAMSDLYDPNPDTSRANVYLNVEGMEGSARVPMGTQRQLQSRSERQLMEVQLHSPGLPGQALWVPYDQSRCCHQRRRAHSLPQAQPAPDIAGAIHGIMANPLGGDTSKCDGSDGSLRAKATLCPTQRRRQPDRQSGVYQSAGPPPAIARGVDDQAAGAEQNRAAAVPGLG